MVEEEKLVEAPHCKYAGDRKSEKKHAARENSELVNNLVTRVATSLLQVAKKDKQAIRPGFWDELCYRVARPGKAKCMGLFGAKRRGGRL